MKMAMEMVTKKRLLQKGNRKETSNTSKNMKIHKFEVFIGQKGGGRGIERAGRTFTHPNVLAGPCLVL